MASICFQSTNMILNADICEIILRCIKVRIYNGTEASVTFAEMAIMETVKLEEYREYLLKYCGLDTFAMVKVWERLREAVK